MTLDQGTTPLPPNSDRDRRFSGPAWQLWPFNLISQTFQMQQRWWNGAANNMLGVLPEHRKLVAFSIQQLLDVFSPSNFIWTNPEILARTFQTGGANLWLGLQRMVEDSQNLLSHATPAGENTFVVGRDVAITPGNVVFRNDLIELIQYLPLGEAAHPEPILIVPSWIMKYYILDLSPGNSLVRYLLGQGHSVFVMSWKNPTAADANLDLDDYLRLGVMQALDAVEAIAPKRKVHAVGYCLGGTLLVIAAAAMGRDGDRRLASMSLLAAEADFSEPGELALFIDDQQISALENIMSMRGYLDDTLMATAFQLLNSRDLIWSRMVKEYWMGEQTQVSDLMAWNADGTRLPCRMHSETLRRLFLQNDLANNRYLVAGIPVRLADIDCPIFCLGTERDQVAPWRSVYKLHDLTHAETTFVLTSGGHNVGIVNPPGVEGRSYHVLTRLRNGPSLAPEAWLAAASLQEGSWWPCWAEWLRDRSGEKTSNLPMSMALSRAPGHYVLEQ